MKTLQKSITLLTAAILLTFVVSCTTVTQTISSDHAASFSGNVRDGGVIGLEIHGDILVDNNFVARYNKLARLYGKRLNPEITEDLGIKEAKGPFYIKVPRTKVYSRFLPDSSKKYYFITAQYYTAFLDMYDIDTNALREIKK